MTNPEFLPASWMHFFGGPVPYDDPQTADDGPAGDAAPMDPFEWLKAHPWPPERPTRLPPILTPEEFSDAPLTPEQRDRRADLLARVRDANHHPRR